MYDFLSESLFFFRFKGAFYFGLKLVRLKLVWKSGRISLLKIICGRSNKVTSQSSKTVSSMF